MPKAYKVSESVPKAKNVCQKLEKCVSAKNHERERERVLKKEKESRLKQERELMQERESTLKQDRRKS